MRVILIKEICKEMPNSRTLDAFNSAVMSGINSNIVMLSSMGYKEKSKAIKLIINKIKNNELSGKELAIAKGVLKDYNSKKDRMRNFKTENKKHKEVEKSLKGLDKGLQRAILSAI